MRQLIGISVILIFFFTCKAKEEHLSQAKFADILTDLHLAEAYAQVSPKDSAGLMIKNRDSIFAHYNYIFNRHKMNFQELQKALIYYQEHPEEYEKVYEIVLNNLSAIKEEKTSKEENKTKPIVR